MVILPDRQEVTSEELPSMPDVVRDRVRFIFAFSDHDLVTIIALHNAKTDTLHSLLSIFVQLCMKLLFKN